MKKVKLTNKSTLVLRNIKGFMEREVKPFGTSARIDFPKEFIGKKVYVANNAELDSIIGSNTDTVATIYDDLIPNLQPVLDNDRKTMRSLTSSLQDMYQQPLANLHEISNNYRHPAVRVSYISDECRSPIKSQSNSRAKLQASNNFPYSTRVPYQSNNIRHGIPSTLQERWPLSPNIDLHHNPIYREFADQNEQLALDFLSGLKQHDVLQVPNTPRYVGCYNNSFPHLVGPTTLDECAEYSKRLGYKQFGMANANIVGHGRGDCWTGNDKWIGSSADGCIKPGGSIFGAGESVAVYR